VADKTPEEGSVTRLSFLKTSAGAAAGVAAVGVPVAVAVANEKGGVPVEPTGTTPREPVVAYVRDAARGEVTLVSGTSELTYRDHSLVRRLLAAAPKDSPLTGGSIDVLAP
jgi:hypothetical protein